MKTKMKSFNEWQEDIEKLQNKHQLTKMTWYVVEVSFDKHNPVHRACGYYSHSGYIELFGSYESIQKVRIEDLAYFRVVAPINEMNAKKFPNHFKLPNEASGTSYKKADKKKKRNYSTLVFLTISAIIIQLIFHLIFSNITDADSEDAFYIEAEYYEGSYYFKKLVDKQSKCRYLVVDYDMGGNVAVTQMYGKDGLPLCKKKG